MVIAEAMAMGLPVIAGKASGAVPWVVGDAGTLCDITNPTAITNALIETLVPIRYAELSARAIESVRRRFTTEAVVDKFCTLYEQAVQQRASDFKNTKTARVLT
jgi:glycosyltransferase involved in cell wall biosynthesis